MDTTTPKLKKHNIRRKQTNGCSCNKTTFIYSISVKVDEKIVDALSCFGKPAFDFKKTAILKIENPQFAITGIKRLKEVRLTLKKGGKGVVDKFEDVLINYLEEKK